MKRLLLSISSLSLDEMELNVNEYRIVLTTWNNNLNAYYVKLTLYADYGKTYYLEHSIQKNFYSSGQKIENLVRQRRSKSALRKSDLTSIFRDLDNLQARIFKFNRDLLFSMEDIRRRVFFGRKLYYNNSSILQFSNLELIKALFVSDVDAHAVFRASVNPSFPRRRS